jgi:hypothetical protein
MGLLDIFKNPSTITRSLEDRNQDRVDFFNSANLHNIEIPSYDPNRSFEEQFGHFREGTARGIIDGLVCPHCQSIRTLLYVKRGGRKFRARFWHCDSCHSNEDVSPFIDTAIDTFGSSERDLYADTIVKLLIEKKRNWNPNYVGGSNDTVN